MPAKKILFLISLISLSYAGCKNTESNDNKHNEPVNVSKNTWYKHFTGTVNGREAMVNLQYNGKYVQGSYYYTDKGEITDLLPQRRAKADAGNLAFTENNSLLRTRDEDSSVQRAWQLSIQGTTANGKWISTDGKTEGAITLKETYNEGTYPLTVLVRGDSLTERKGVVHVTAASFYDLVQPSDKMKKDDADFLRVSILHFLGGDFQNVKNSVDYTLQEDKKYFQDFEKLLADMQIDRDAHEDWEYSFDHTRTLQALLNSNGMLVLRLGESDHTGGGVMGSHFRNRYVCIDMTQRKVWQLKDMINVDATKLTPLLNDAARAVFGLQKGPLTEKLRVDDVSLTENVYVTGTGIAFCYYPGVIAPEEDGEICLFVPYARLGKLLKEDFKKRMGL